MSSESLKAISSVACKPCLPGPERQPPGTLPAVWLLGLWGPSQGQFPGRGTKHEPCILVRSPPASYGNGPIRTMWK